MARILIGWEFGANRGHSVRAAMLARLLRARGHEVVFVLQRLDGLSTEELEGAELWQAPLSPRLLATSARRPTVAPAGMAEIIARLGFDEAEIVASVVRGWQQILRAVRPDVVIADFAPFMLCAARGRIPSVSVGTGFTDPPGNMADFPPLVEAVSGLDQAQLLATVNGGLDQAGVAPLKALPEIYKADRPIVATFTELDPYAAWRKEPLALPEAVMPDVLAGNGEEVFVYAPERVNMDAPLWRGLAASGLKVRVYVARANSALRAGLSAYGFIAEADPVPFPLIAERSRVLVSHGGHGTVCAALAAGLPQVVCHHDVEKLGHARAVALLGVGGHVPLHAIKPEAFGESLVRLHADGTMAARARAVAPGFRNRPGPAFGDAVVEAVSALI